MGDGRGPGDAGRAELARHLRPYRASLEAVDVVEVVYGHRKGAVRRVRAIVVLRLAVPDEAVTVAGCLLSVRVCSKQRTEDQEMVQLSPKAKSPFLHRRRIRKVYISGRMGTLYFHDNES